MQTPETPEQAAMRELGLVLGRSMEQFAARVGWAIERAATRFAVEPSYLRFVFERPSSGWPRLAPEDRRLLAMAVKLVDSFGVPADDEVAMLGSEQDHQVDMALSWLARWSRSVLAPEMKRAYVSALHLDPSTGEVDDDALGRLERFERWLHGPTQLNNQRSLAAIVDELFA